MVWCRYGNTTYLCCKCCSRICRTATSLSNRNIIVEPQHHCRTETSLSNHIIVEPKHHIETQHHCRTETSLQVKAVRYSQDWSSRERLAILSMCNKLGAAIGGCERLVQTPVPLHYVRHTSRFLTIWCFLLPLVIGEKSPEIRVIDLFPTCYKFISKFPKLKSE